LPQSIPFRVTDDRRNYCAAKKAERENGFPQTHGQRSAVFVE
jgi:hypothetical protein